MEGVFEFSLWMHTDPSPPGELAVGHRDVIFIIIRRGRGIKRFNCLTLQQLSCGPGDPPGTSRSGQAGWKIPWEWPFGPCLGHLRQSALVGLDGP